MSRQSAIAASPKGAYRVTEAHVLLFQGGGYTAQNSVTTVGLSLTSALPTVDGPDYLQQWGEDAFYTGDRVRLRYDRTPINDRWHLGHGRLRLDGRHGQASLQQVNRLPNRSNGLPATAATLLLSTYVSGQDIALLPRTISAADST